MIEIIKGSTQKPISSEQLINALSETKELNGLLYVGYPIFSTPEGRYPIDAILISPEKGVILIHIVEGRILPDNYQDTQDDIYNKLEAKLRNHKALMKGRNLDVPISVLTFSPAVTTQQDADDEYPVCSKDNLITTIENIKDEKFEKYNHLLSVLQSISTIRKGIKKRNIAKSDSRGAKLQKLEDSIANLDNQQGRAVIETIDAVQRIRGLAGSGKTIVLALKAAYLHSQHPEWKIAVTFNTRSLKGQFKRLITTFTIEQTGEEPEWENLKIIHAWGSGSGEREGLYYNFCKQNELEYFDYGRAKSKFGRGREFDGACSNAVDAAKKILPLYDAILIDEAQDFPPSFLRLCFSVLGDKKRLVYAYDELQSLNTLSLPSPEEIFGYDSHSNPIVTLTEKSQDIILEKCYRNSKPVLTTAHALGFGIFRNKDPKTGTGLIQMFDDSHLWEDVGYSVVSGRLEDEIQVTLERTENSSPAFLVNQFDIDDLIQFHSFATEGDQIQWVVEEIKRNLRKDELRVDDIIVINPDPLKTKNAVGPIRAELFKHKINSHLAGVDTTPDVFFYPELDSIVFTGIYRAKGNEAGMVYIINAQDCYESFGRLATVRNQLFTAITRSKAWVRVLGIGPNMDKLKKEFERVKENEFKLTFVYPNAELRTKLNIVNRDMSEAEKKSLKKADRSLHELLEGVESGDVHIDDLDAGQVEKLKNFLLEKD
ncbi:DEAD/DEAH box helicase [Desulforhopalus vacuolatus]|uniref:DEAD/DEAH box helicase n=1 Tax=Desulforhopalus vacuolatus TaxID=40414 RepID=UPI001965D122|nr:ATP-binding domain-containing protein [Desulforhopalus vacuolatus]MBM9518768.1 DEAD/DEAH box helicase [Desulforhopalus vacuolatus]